MSDPTSPSARAGDLTTGAALTEVSPATEPALLRRAYGRFPSGVIALCARRHGQPIGMAVSAFTPVSLHPPLVGACIQNTSSTWPVLRRCSRVGISVLGEGHESQCRSLSSTNGDRFHDVDWQIGDDDEVFIAGSALWLSGSITEEVPAGDHVVALFTVHRLGLDIDAAPLVFHDSRFQGLAQLAQPELVR